MIDDTTPAPSELIFRDHKYRKQVQKKINNVLVCPAENGVTKLTCEKCKLCFKK